MKPAPQDGRFSWGRIGKFLLPVLILFVVQQIVFFRLGFTPLAGDYVLLGDFNALHYLVNLFDSDAYRSGIVPLWNPYVYSGFPWATGMEHRVFYPVQVLVSLLVGYSYTVMRVEFMLTVLFSGVGFFLLLQEFDLRRPACYFGAVSYLSSGFFVGNAQAFGAIIAYAFTPWVLWQLYKLHKTNRTLHAVYCAVLLALAITGGYPGIYVVFGYILAVLCVVMVARSEERLRMAMNVAVMGGLAVGLAALHVWLGYSGLALTGRGAGLSYDMAVVQHSLAPIDLFTTVLPSAATNPVFSRGPEVLQSITDRNVHLGVLVPCLALAGLFAARKRGLLWAIFGGCVLLVLAAMGDATVVRPLMYKYLPAMDVLRHNSQIFRGFSMLGLLLIAAFGLNHFYENRPKIKKAWLVLLLPALLAVAISLGRFTGPQKSVLYGDLPIALGVLVVFLGLFVAFRKDVIGERAFSVSLIALVVAEFFFAVNVNHGTLWTYAPQFKTKILAAEKSRDRDFRNLAVTERAYRVMNGDYYLPLLDRVPSDFGYPSMMLDTYQAFIKTNLYAEQRSYNLRRNTVQFPEFVTYYGKDAEVRNHLNSLGLRSLRSAAGIKNPGEELFGKSLHFDGRAVFRGFSRYSLNTIEFGYDSDGERLALLDQVFFPGWEAYRKETGEKIPVGRYNLAFIGLQLPPGPGTVVLEFKPAPYLIGRWISLFSIALTLGVVVLLKLRERKGGRGIRRSDPLWSDRGPEDPL